LIESIIGNYGQKFGSIISILMFVSLPGYSLLNRILMINYSMRIDQEPAEIENNANKRKIEEFRTPGTLLSVWLVIGIFFLCAL
jgi:hypothetical protein